MTSTVPVKPVVVGVDGEEADLAVLTWAAQEAQRRGSELVIAHGRDVIPATPAAETAVVAVLSEAADFGRDLLVDATQFVTDGWPQIPVRTVLRVAKPAELLVELSSEAALIVLGTHGDNRFIGALLGSVSQKVAAHAHCPVVVLPSGREALDPAGPRNVVVGVSPSVGGAAALRFAFAEAQLREADVVAVRSWTEPAIYGIGSAGVGYIVPPPLTTLRECEQAILDGCLVEVAKDFPQVKVRAVLTESSSDHALVDYAQDAAVLVVGCRHSDGHRLSRLGPIGSWLLHHSPVPVAVVGFPAD